MFRSSHVARQQCWDHKVDGQGKGHTGDPESERGRGFSENPVLPGNRMGITRSSIFGITKTCCKKERQVINLYNFLG